MSRIENAINKINPLPKHTSLDEASLDKLRSISEALLEILLSVDAVTEIDLETCQKLFQGLCISQRSRVQFLAATLLDRLCKKQPYWGTFLAETLAEMFSSSYTTVFPQDKVFVLLSYLARKSTDKSSVLDATLKVIAQLLEPLNQQNKKTLLAMSVDLTLLGWLLLFLSLQLDLSKGALPNSSRWDWVTGEMDGKINDGSGPGPKKKSSKKVSQYKQQLDNLEFTHKMVHNSAQVQVCTIF